MCIRDRMAGFIYGNVGEKATLALRWLAEKRGVEWRPFFDDVSALEAKLEITRNGAMSALQAETGLDAQAATRLLWETYSPNLHVWLPFAAIGVLSAIALIVFSHMAKKWKDMNA